jgi:ribosomal protein S9
MAQLLATYALRNELHRIELVKLRDGAIVLDRAADCDSLVVAELARDEGEEQALAVIHGGGYLKRARAGELGLCRALTGTATQARTARAEAA